MAPPKKDPKAKGEAEDDEKQGLELFLYTLYEEAFAYRSIKMMKIWNWRLTCASPHARGCRRSVGGQGATHLGGSGAPRAGAGGNNPREEAHTCGHRPADMSRTFVAGVALYVLFFIFLDHGYLQKEAPFVGVDLSLSMVRACQQRQGVRHAALAPRYEVLRAPVTRRRSLHMRRAR